MFWLDDFELVVLYSSLADTELQLGVFWEREIDGERVDEDSGLPGRRTDGLSWMHFMGSF
jgi:hypothetical protein